MNDLLIAVALLLSLSIALGVTAFFLLTRSSDRVRTTLTILLVAATTLFAAFFYGRLAMARLVPVSSTIVLGNWIPLILAVVIGTLAGRKSIASWGRFLM